MRTGTATFVWGATEGPVRWIDALGAPARRKRAWHRTGNRKDMIASFREGGGSGLGTGYYTTYVCRSIPAPDPTGAIGQVAKVEKKRYGIFCSTCVDDVHGILTAYGAADLPPRKGRWFPTLWFSRIRWKPPLQGSPSRA